MKNNTQKITNIFLDIDGCLTPGKYRALNLKTLDYLKNELSRINAEVSLCTGRSQPYAELMLQILGLYDKKATHIYEHGCCLNDVGYNKDFNYINPKIKLKVVDFLKEIEKTFKNSSIFTVEPGKNISISLNSQSGEHISKLDSICKKSLPNNWENYVEVKLSADSIDISPLGINKGSAIKDLGIDLSTTLVIGDSAGDFSMLEIVGYPTCPGNASTEVKDLVISRGGFVANFFNTGGIVEILNHFKKKGLL